MRTPPLKIFRGVNYKTSCKKKLDSEKFLCYLKRAARRRFLNRQVRTEVGEFIRVEVFSLYAIIKTGGKQYKVAEGSEVIIEKLDVEEGSSVTFEEVLVVGEGEEIKIGRPFVEGAKVTGSVVKNGKGPKLRIFKYKHKTNYRRRQGHRQPFTKVKIEKIES